MLCLDLGRNQRVPSSSGASSRFASEHLLAPVCAVILGDARIRLDPSSEGGTHFATEESQVGRDTRSEPVTGRLQANSGRDRCTNRCETRYVGHYVGGHLRIKDAGFVSTFVVGSNANDGCGLVITVRPICGWGVRINGKHVIALGL